MLVNNQTDTIFSLSTAIGTGALAIIRISGKESSETIKNLTKREIDESIKNKILLFKIYANGDILDETLISFFKSPQSFTKEDMVEIYCHNSTFIIQTLLNELLKLNIRQANPGEFTQRAFLNGRFDLAQAEAIADLIASDTKAAHQIAMSQMRGGISSDIKLLRTQLIEFAALIELELDFGEEDVIFANRAELKKLISRIQDTIIPLIQSFTLGNSIKTGIPIVIAGKPNAGKSTLLNSLLNEERAIVSEIPGTTRDIIEDEIIIEGIKFRLIDTAGLRKAQDAIEEMGIKKTHQKLKQASLILYLFDPLLTTPTLLTKQINNITELNIPYILIGNKLDVVTPKQQDELNKIATITWISAANNTNMDILKQQILDIIQAKKINDNNTIITNTRHFAHLTNTHEALNRVISNLEKNTSSDWIALDIRDALNELGAITGEITNDDILSTIFSKFCIGK